MPCDFANIESCVKFHRPEETSPTMEGSFPFEDGKPPHEAPFGS